MKKKNKLLKTSVFCLLATVAALFALTSVSCLPEPGLLLPGTLQPSPVEQIPPEERGPHDWILLGAREEVANGTRYDASYYAMSYPEGDVASEIGACTDVIIRAFRYAGFDLQRLIHEDMKENFNLYPQLWGLNGTDTNIDHRRTQNQMTFFERFGQVLTLDVSEETLGEWQHGDIVYWLFPDGQQHTGIISDRTNGRGIPLVIHNANITREEDRLLRWEIIGHYRFP